MLEKSKLLQLAKEWLEYDKFEETRKEMEQLIKDNNFKELNARLGKRIEFGTAGLRSIMGAGTAYINQLVVVQTTQGLVEYLLQELPECKNNGVVIGYDARYHSKEYAQLTASVFVSKQIPVYLFSNHVCTPFVPFAVTHLKTSAGIMITASHNPKQYNGYKLYWNNGCQVIFKIVENYFLHIY